MLLQHAQKVRNSYQAVGITAFVRTESNMSVKLPTSERQPTAVIIRPYVIHSTVYIRDLCPTEKVNAFYSTAHLHFQHKPFSISQNHEIHFSSKEE
jgi:hypothetical protein